MAAAGEQVAASAHRFHIDGMRAIMFLSWLLVCAILPVASVVGAAASPSSCGPAILSAEAARHTAPGLLAAIALVESGRTDRLTGRRAPWPWTVTAEGVGTYYPGKREAIGAVQALQARGVRSIDVGCLQVNLLHHAAAFRDLDEAFDPAANAAYASRFLVSLFDRLGTWPKAAAAYHSMTPELGAQYSRLVAAVWAGGTVPVVEEPGGIEIVRFPGGGQMRIMREATGAVGRVAGYLSGP